MTYKIRFLLIAMTCAVFTSGFAQNSAGMVPTGVGFPVFTLRVFSTFEEDSGEPAAKVIAQFVNDNLTFVKNDSAYEAEVQIEYFMTEKTNDYVFNRTVDKKVVVEDYEYTESRKALNTFYIEMPVIPGSYEVVVTAMDKNNQKQFSQTASFEFTDGTATDQKFIVSDILFFGDYQTDTDGSITSFNPELTNAFSSEKKYVYAYFNSFVYSSKDSVLIKYRVKDDRGVTVTQNQYMVGGDDQYKEHFIRLSRYYFNRKKYVFELFANSADQWIVKNTAFGFFWRFSPNTMQDLDLALDQLKYVAENDSLKLYKKAPFSEKKKFFERFWRDRDPDPGTEDNEIMNEYYRRISFVNSNFSSSGVPGWLSDRGRIFIKFGEPDEIERHPFDAQSYPYQIWRYFSVNKVFLFIDRTGFGDYDLHPSYYYVEFE